eukprot:CAMPEP_0116128894 /NCGR_PEP_ID=MMETSP0329-20121206/7631_1 /TAXON_ID=697910 /ORGANISM="Pseudo-nitzschia arenysensis, Strain B593" /LENGTH=365 /DNA_ID=CAMNT_0003623119 /DNA_START=33 /DNA_END=1131 /DNA_ORIENTATION=+
MRDRGTLKLKVRTRRVRPKRHVVFLMVIGIMAYWISASKIESISEELVAHREMEQFATLTADGNLDDMDVGLDHVKKANATVTKPEKAPKVPIKTKGEVSNTAIVIVSSWKPSNPRTERIENTIQSIVQNAIGLPKTSPVFVVLDHVDDFQTRNPNFMKSNPKIHIVGPFEVLDVIRHDYPSIQYLYQTHEDYLVSAPLDHPGLIRTMSNPPKKELLEMTLFYFGDHAYTSRKCIRDRLHRWSPIRLSSETETVHAQIERNGLGAPSATSKAFLCASCLYSYTTTHLVNLEWYYHMWKAAQQHNHDNAMDTIVSTEEALTAEVQKLCERKKQLGETSGLYLYFDDRLYFGNNGLRYIGNRTIEFQ